MPGLWTCRMWPIRGRTCVYVSKFLIVYLLMIDAVISQGLYHWFMKTAESDFSEVSVWIIPYNCINRSNVAVFLFQPLSRNSAHLLNAVGKQPSLGLCRFAAFCSHIIFLNLSPTREPYCDSILWHSKCIEKEFSCFQETTMSTDWFRIKVMANWLRSMKAATSCKRRRWILFN